MLVLILERVPVRLRGELSRWLIEPRTGVFVGRVSALVRDRLWEKVCEQGSRSRRATSGRKAGAVLIYRAQTEQGFQVRTFGDPSRELVELEGLTLVRIPRSDPPADPAGTEEPAEEEAAAAPAEEE